MKGGGAPCSVYWGGRHPECCKGQLEQLPHLHGKKCRGWSGMAITIFWEKFKGSSSPVFSVQSAICTICRCGFCWLAAARLVRSQQVRGDSQCCLCTVFERRVRLCLAWRLFDLGCRLNALLVHKSIKFCSFNDVR